MRYRFFLWLLVGLGLLSAFLWVPLPLFDRTRLQHTIAIDQPPERVFAYVTTPANWPRWHPSSLGVRGAVDHPLTVGEQVTERFQVAGRRGEATWTVRDRQAPQRWVIAAPARGGDVTITYELAPIPIGTQFMRTLDYPSPTVWLALLNRWRIRAQIDAESAEALRRLKAVLDALP